MALTVATNTGALMAQAAASSVNKEMEMSMERLSTGKRINSAADDAAGVAISSRLTAEIKGTNQAIRNAMDGQAMIDTAEGAHVEVENILQRMRELAVQASNGSNSEDDRAMLQLEVDALLTEVDRISQASTWAGQALLNGVSGDALASSHDDVASFKFQVGSRTHSADQIVASVGAITSAALGLSGANNSGSTTAVSTEGPARMSVNNGTVQIEGDLKHGDVLSFDVNNVAVAITFSTTDEYTNDLDGVSAQLKDRVDALVTAKTILSPVQAVDNGNGSVTLSQLGAPTITTVGETNAGTGTFTVSGSTFTVADTWATGDVATATINGTAITYTSAANDGFDHDAVVGVAAGFVDQIRSNAALANIIATDNGDGTVSISQLEVPEIQSAEVTLKTAAEASLSYDDTNKLTIGGSFVDGMNYSFDLFGQTVSVTASTDDGFADTKAGVASQIAAAINDLGLHGITASKTANENAVTIAGTVTAANGAVNSGTEFLVTTVGALATAEVHVNNDATQTDAAASYTAGDSYSFDVAGETFTLVVGADGYENDIDGVTQQMIELVENAHIPGLSVVANKGTTAGVAISYDLTKASGGGGSEVITNVKVMDSSIASGTTNTASADNISISTVEQAAAAIAKIDTAMDTINSQRASLGATSNRLDSTVSNLTNISSNLQAGRGRIEDADFAAETTSLAKSQILQQASTAMLAQANASKQNVLSLLQG
jgi:flagellin